MLRLMLLSVDLVLMATLSTPLASANETANKMSTTILTKDCASLVPDFAMTVALMKSLMGLFVIIAWSTIRIVFNLIHVSSNVNKASYSALLLVAITVKTAVTLAMNATIYRYA